MWNHWAISTARREMVLIFYFISCWYSTKREVKVVLIFHWFHMVFWINVWECLFQEIIVGTSPVGNCMNLPLVKLTSMILISWKSFIICLFQHTSVHIGRPKRKQPRHIIKATFFLWGKSCSLQLSTIPVINDSTLQNAVSTPRT